VPDSGARSAATCPPRRTFPVHLELFAHRLAIVIPPGIGRCADVARTRMPTGVIEVAAGATVTLGDFFRIWGRPLAATRLLSFRGAPVRAWVGGRRVRGDVDAIPLTPRAQIVVELGGYVPPHASFLFPPARA
jgi:hypothetical protein